MKAYRFKTRIVEIQPFEELSSKNGMTKYIYRGIDQWGKVMVELKDRNRTPLVFHPQNLWDVMVRDD